MPISYKKYLANHYLEPDEDTGLIYVDLSSSSLSSLGIKWKLVQAGGSIGDSCRCTLRVYKSDQSTLLETAEMTAPGFNSTTLYPDEAYFSDPIYIKITNDGDTNIHTYILGPDTYIPTQPTGVTVPNTISLKGDTTLSSVLGAKSVPWDAASGIPTKMLIYGWQKEVASFDAQTDTVDNEEFSVPERYGRVHITTNDAAEVYICANDTSDPTKESAVFSYDGTDLTELDNVPQGNTGQMHFLIWSVMNSPYNDALMCCPIVGFPYIYYWDGDSWEQEWEITPSGGIGSYYYGVSEIDGYICWVDPNVCSLYIWDKSEEPVEPLIYWDALGCASQIDGVTKHKPFFTFGDSSTGRINILGKTWTSWDGVDARLVAYAGNTYDFCGGNENGEGVYGVEYNSEAYAIDENGDLYRADSNGLYLEGSLYHTTQGAGGGYIPQALIILQNDENDNAIYIVTAEGHIYMREVD